jgi:dihydroxyacetone kinase
MNHTKLYKSSPLKNSFNPQRTMSSSIMSSLNMQGVYITITEIVNLLSLLSIFHS